MKNKEKNTKERILEEALNLFARNGYLGTSMNDIASSLGLSKAALYKHYKSKQQIFDCIVEKMNKMDQERVKKYDMPEGTMEEVVKGYQETAIDQIKEFTKVQFLHWTQEEFPCNFRKMLTLEQYRDPNLAMLYHHYLASGPLLYMEKIFKGFTDHEEEAKQLALDFYGPVFLLYSIYDNAEDKDLVVNQVEEHVERFSKMLLEKRKK